MDIYKFFLEEVEFLINDSFGGMICSGPEQFSLKKIPRFSRFSCY